MSYLKWPLKYRQDPFLILRRTDAVVEDDVMLTIVDTRICDWSGAEREENYRATLCRDGLPDCDVICTLVIGKKNVIRLRQLAKLYGDKLKELQGDIIPACYGMFEGEPEDDDLTACFVVSYCGEPLEVPLFGQSWEFKDKVLGMLIMIHEAGVEHGNFRQRNVVVDKGGEPWIIDFHNARTHECEQTIPIEFHTEEPDMYEFGCDEIWRAAQSMGTWTPSRIRFRRFSLPIEYAISAEELASHFPPHYSEASALEEAAHALEEHRKFLKARRECDWKSLSRYV